MFLIALAVVGLVAGAFALAVIHADRVNTWLWALWEVLQPQRLRGRGWGWLLVPLGLSYSQLDGGDHQFVALAVLAGVLTPILAPRLARKAVPYAVLALAAYGLVLAKGYHDGNTNQVLYGLVLAGAGSWRSHLVLPQAMLFFAAGLWLLLRVHAPGAGRVRALAARWRSTARRGILPAQGFLLLPVAVLAMALLGPRIWFGLPESGGPRVIAADAAVATLSLVLVFRSRVWAATLAEAGLLVLGAYGLLIAALWPAVPGFVYGVASLADSRPAVLGGAVQGTALLALGLWLAPRVMREYRGVPADLELAERASQLTERVQTLTQTCRRPNGSSPPARKRRSRWSPRLRRAPPVP